MYEDINGNGVYDGPGPEGYNGAQIILNETTNTGLPVSTPQNTSNLGGNWGFGLYEGSYIHATYSNYTNVSVSLTISTIPAGYVLSPSSPVSVTVNPSVDTRVDWKLVRTAPKGFHDNSDCSVSGGWTCDPDNYSQALDVHFYDGPGFTTFIGAVTANQTREPAVGAECGGNSNHGFTFTTPASVKDGTNHSIYAYPINIGAGAGYNPLLGGSPRSISCSITNTISGSVFVDANGDGRKNVGESNYTGAITITSSGTGDIGTYPSPGSFLISNAQPGLRTISYGNLPAGYRLTYPINGPPPSFRVRVGPSCDNGGSLDAICSGGNITNLNFGITINASPWIQATGGNIRIDSGINDQIPSNADPLCGGAYMSLPGNGGQPGIVHSGARSASFGNGQASANPYNWVVSAPDGQKYTPPTPNTVRTSYNYLLSNASQLALTINDLTAQCSGGLSNCNLSANIPTGVYKADGNVTLTNANYTFPASRNIVILVNGNLTFGGKVHVPSGSTAMFSVSGDIHVDKGVGEATNTSSLSDLEGIFSADKNFIVEGNNSCSVGVDLRLNIAGNVISNAAYGGGSFVNQRNLCLGNICPSVSFTQRLDLIINLPPLLRAPNYIWKEVAP